MTRIKKNKLFFVVLLAYILVGIFNRDMFLLSLSNSLYYLKEMVLIMPVVFVMIIFIEAWIPKKKISQYLGENSGVKGTVFAYLLGSLSAGPVYAAFPFASMLLSKGASIKNIVIIISAWAVIKIPMLANEGKFLGVRFMTVRWALTVAAVYFIAKIMEKSVQKSQIVKETEKL